MAREESCASLRDLDVTVMVAPSHRHTLRLRILDALCLVSLSRRTGFFQEGIFPLSESGSWVSGSEAQTC